MTFTLNTFVDNTKILASKVNENFEGLQGDIGSNYTTLNSAITTLNNTVSSIQSAAANVPKGTVLWFTGEAAPTGYLICNGAAVSRTDYADLFDILGTTFGAGDESTTFNLPTLTDNRFIEGHTTVGTETAAGLPNITGNIGRPSNWAGGSATGAFYSLGAARAVDSEGNAQSWDYVAMDASRSSDIYSDSVTTVQPKSLTLLPCIKY